MPEGLFNDGDLKIHDFTIESPKKDERRFVAERDITNDDWQTLLRLLESRRKIELRDEITNNPGVTPYDLSDQLVAMLTLFPGRRDELNISETDYLKISKAIDQVSARLQGSSNDETNLSSIVRWAANLKLIFPEPDHFDSAGYNPDIWTAVDRMLHRNIRDSNIDRYVVQALHFAIYMPSKVTEYGDLDEADWSRLTRRSFSMATGDELANVLIFLKLLDPERYAKGTQGEVGERQWAELRQSLDDNRARMTIFAQLAMKMKILSAKSARITENGIELNESASPDLEVIPPMPEKRGF
jgi:hypothetical protein